MVRLKHLLAAPLLFWTAMGTTAASAQAPSWADCAGRVIILGTASQREGEGFVHWASLSNPGMRAVLVAPRFEGGPAIPIQRIEAGRLLRLRLGEGGRMLSAAEIEIQTRLRCRPG